MTTDERASFVIEVCAYELRNVAQDDLNTLRWAIKNQLDEETRDVISRYSKSTSVEKQFKHELKNFDLLKIRKKSKKN